MLFGIFRGSGTAVFRQDYFSDLKKQHRARLVDNPGFNLLPREIRISELGCALERLPIFERNIASRTARSKTFLTGRFFYTVYRKACFIC